MAQDPNDPIQSPPSIPPSERLDDDYSPSSERETERLQDDQAGSDALQDPDIDRDSINLLPGTGDYTDDGDVDVDPGEIHMPRSPGRSDARPGQG